MNYFSESSDFKSNNQLNGYAFHEIILDSNEKPIDFVFIDMNTTFEILTGLNREDIIGRKGTEVIPEIEKSEFYWIGFYGRIALDGTLLKKDFANIIAVENGEEAINILKT